jgi:RNA binding exosome subunit
VSVLIHTLSKEGFYGYMMTSMQTGLKKAMLQRTQELIDQFNRDEDRWWRLQWRKVVKGADKKVSSEKVDVGP